MKKEICNRHSRADKYSKKLLRTNICQQNRNLGEMGKLMGKYNLSTLKSKRKMEYFHNH